MMAAPLRVMATVALFAALTAASACTTRRDVQCSDDTHCDLTPGGVCLLAPSGRHWCAFPDSTCPSGRRYADLDVGDGLAGACVDASDNVDAGADASASDASATDAGLADASVDGGASCKDDVDCSDVTAPICDDTTGTCRACETPGGQTAECMARDPLRPFCASDGRCVECLGTSDCATAGAAVCDPIEFLCRACTGSSECAGSPFGDQCNAAGACVECLDHGDCASTVCDRDAFTCVAGSDVIYVGGTGAADTAMCGTVLAPCATVQFALSRVTASTKHLRIAPGTYPSDDTVIVSGMEVTVIGPGAHLLVVPEDTPVVRVNSGSTLELDGLTIRNASANDPASAAHGVLCENTSTTLVLRRVEVRANGRHGVVVSACDVAIEESIVGDNVERGVDVSSGTLRVVRSRIENNRLGGILLNPGAFHIENSLIVDNGDASSSVGGLVISNFDALSPQALLYNTIAGNQADPGAAASGVDCAVIASPPTLVGNIVYLGSGPSASVAGSGCDWEYSDIENGPAGTGNLDVDPQFVDAAGGDYHLQSGSPVRDMGTTLPAITVDFEGDPRDDGAYDIGADEFVPQ